MNSALQLKYLHLNESSNNPNQINWLLVLLTFTLPCSMDCMLEQLAPVLLILHYHLDFRTSWHVLSLPLSHAHLQIVLEMSWHLDGTGLAGATQENITAKHVEKRAGIVKTETNLAEILKNQQIQSFADVGWFVPSRGYCFQRRYLSVCCAAGVSGTRARSRQEDHGQDLRPEDMGSWGGGDPANMG